MFHQSRGPHELAFGYTVKTTKAQAFVCIFSGREGRQKPNTYPAATGLECLLNVGNVASSAIVGWDFPS